jgi:hypothetical protein
VSEAESGVLSSEVAVQVLIIVFVCACVSISIMSHARSHLLQLKTMHATANALAHEGRAADARRQYQVSDEFAV